MFRIIDTAIDWTNSCALWFIVKTYALRAFGGYYVINIHTYGKLRSIAIEFGGLIEGSNDTAQPGSFAVFPFCTTLVNGIVWAFWFAGAAIDTFIGNHDSHNTLSY